MRILISGSYYPPELNGQSIFTANLAEGMAARGHAVRVLIPGSGRQATRSIRNGVEVVELPSLRLAFNRQALRLSLFAMPLVATELEDFHPEVVHVQDPSPLSQVIVREAKKRGIPALATHHTGPEITAPYLTKAPAWIKKALSRVAWKLLLQHLNRADQVTVPSHSSVTMLDAKGLRNSAIPVSCGIRLDNFHPQSQLDRAAVRRKYGLDPDKVLTLYVGRIDVEKQVEVLIRAMALLPDDSIQLAIAGTGSLEPALRRLVQRQHLGARIRFLGQVTRAALPELINSADLFSMPGDVESFSIATLEAMACGKPVLAANSSALPELITQGVNGYLFTPRDPQDAARGLLQLVQNRAQWETMGRINMDRARRHRLETVMSKYERIYQSSRQLAPATAINPAGLPGGFRVQLHSPELTRGLAFRPLTFLMLLAFLLFSMLFSADSTYAAPEVSNQDLKTIDLTEIRNLLVISPDNDSGLASTNGLIRAVIDEGGSVQVLVLPGSMTGSVPNKGSAEESQAGVVEASPAGAAQGQADSSSDHSLSSALLDLGIPQEMVAYLEPQAAASDPSGADQQISGAGNRAAHLNLGSLSTLRSEEKSFIQDLSAALKKFKPDTILVPKSGQPDSQSQSIDGLTQFALAAGYLNEGNQPFPLLFAYLFKDGIAWDGGSEPNSIPAQVLDGQADGWYRFPEDQAASTPATPGSAPQPEAVAPGNELFYKIPFTQENLLPGNRASSQSEPLTLAKIWLDSPLGKVVFHGQDPLALREVHIDGNTCYALEFAQDQTGSQNEDASSGKTLGACLQKQEIEGNHAATAYSIGFWNSGASGMDVWRLVLMAPN